MSNTHANHAVEKISATLATQLESIAKQFATPTYVYDKACIVDAYQAYVRAFGKRKHQICYAVKANSNLSVLALLNELGAGFDIVSMGELQRVIMAGAETSKVIFSGVGKTIDEIAFALDVGIEAFDIESLAELQTILQVAEEMQVIAPISIRFNPDVDAKTHPYISTGLRESKFGLPEEDAFAAYAAAQRSPWIKIVGINMHIGSQLSDINAFREALSKQKSFIYRLDTELGIQLKHINCGGGLGIAYQNDDVSSNTFAKQPWIDCILEAYAEHSAILVIEPGRSLVGESGFLLTEVLYRKENHGIHFAIVDAAMNDYARVALYQAHNEICNLGQISGKSTEDPRAYHIVGPICESGDIFAKNREITLVEGDILAICDVGAYGFSMASNYNSRGRAAEVLLDDQSQHGYRLIRHRESFAEQIEAELHPEHHSEHPRDEDNQ